MKTPSLLATIVTVLIFFSACQKHYDPETTNNDQKQSNASAASLADQLVITPFGMMPQKNVHFVGKGYSLSLLNGHLKKIETKTETIIEDFGETGIRTENTNTATNSTDGKAASGWVAYAYWANADTVAHPVTYFSTSWSVPSAPKRQNNQTLFLFNGMQNGVSDASYIIQPVLQWGASAAGGGKYWAIANWFVSGSQAYYSTLETVSTGTLLQGVIQLTSHSGARYNYNSAFAGYPITESLQINNLPQAWWCSETLETYNIISPNLQYPPDQYVAMQSIKMLENSANAPLNWSTAKANTNAPQKAVVVSDGSPNGEVDLYFRK